MTDGKALDGKHVRQFIFYMAVIALCIAALLYMLLNAKPSVTPKVRDTGGKSSLLLPGVPGEMPPVLRHTLAA